MTAHEKTWLVSSRPGQVGACQSSWGVGGYAGEGSASARVGCRRALGWQRLLHEEAEKGWSLNKQQQHTLDAGI